MIRSHLFAIAFCWHMHFHNKPMVDATCRLSTVRLNCWCRTSWLDGQDRVHGHTPSHSKGIKMCTTDNKKQKSKAQLATQFLLGPLCRHYQWPQADSCPNHVSRFFVIACYVWQPATCVACTCFVPISTYIICEWYGACQAVCVCVTHCVNLCIYINSFLRVLRIVCENLIFSGVFLLIVCNNLNAWDSDWGKGQSIIGTSHNTVSFNKCLLWFEHCSQQFWTLKMHSCENTLNIAFYGR